MNISSIKIKHVLASFGCLFVVAVIFVSILGENNNGVNAARIFLTAVKDRDHTELESSYSRNAKKFATSEESTRYHFMVELALLDHFKLLNADDYRLDLKADSTWFPFISGRYLQIDLRLVPVAEEETLFQDDNQAPYIERAVTAVREDGRWKIAGFNLTDSALKSDYEKLTAKVDYDTFIDMTSDGIMLKQKEISLRQMSALDRRILIHSLENVIERARQSAKKTESIAAKQ